MRVLDLFSGIGGMSLGLERAGMQTVAFCEIEEFPRRVLAKHWPEVPCYEDIKSLTAEDLCTRGISVDVICGGFPCQDISLANQDGQGLEGERSGLWSEYARLVREVRPRFVIVENVSALLGRGFGRVLGDLAAIGYDAEWHCLPADPFGAPHIRDRVWVVAYPSESQRGPLNFSCERVAWFDTLSQRQEGSGGPTRILEAAWGQDPVMVANAIVGMDDGVPVRMDGYNACANAVVTKIPEMIGRAIMEAAA